MIIPRFREVDELNYDEFYEAVACATDDPVDASVRHDRLYWYGRHSGAIWNPNWMKAIDA